MKKEIKIPTPPKHLDEVEQGKWIQFHVNYRMVHAISETANLIVLKDESSLCRFCQKGIPNVTFSKQAHVIPEFAGNKFLFSSNECDLCNKRFSQRESHLANYFQIERTILGIEGKIGVPKFQSGNEFTIETQREGSDLRIDQNGFIPINNLRFDSSSNSMSYEIDQNSYIPYSALQALYKIAYSILPENQLEKFSLMRRVIYDKNKLSELSGMHFPVFGYSGPLNIRPKIHLILYKVRNEVPYDFLPEFMLIITLFNKQVQMPIFSDENFSNMVEEMTLPCYPLISGKSELLDLGVTDFNPKFIDLNSTESMKDKYTIRWNFADEQKM